MSDPQSKRIILTFLGLVFLALVLRMSFLSQGPYHSDCLFLAVQSQKIIQTGQMHYLQSSGLPLTALCGALFVWLFQGGQDIDVAVVAVNTMSALFGAIGVGFFYLFLRKLFNGYVGVVGALLISFHPFVLGLSTFGNSHMPAFLFLSLSLYFTAKYRKEGGCWKIYMAGLCMGLMGATRVQDLFVMAPAFLILMNGSTSKNGRVHAWRDKTIGLGVCSLVIGMAYWSKFFGGSSGGNQVGSFLNEHLLAHFAPLSVSVVWAMIQTLLSSFSPVEWFLALAGLGVLLKQKSYGMLVFLFIWMFVPILVFGHLAFFVFRFLIVTVLALLILEAIAVAAAWQASTKRGIVLTILLFVAVTWNAMPYYQIFWHRHQKALLVDFFRWVGQVTEPGAYVLERDHSAWVQQYAQRNFLGVDRKSAEGLAEFERTLDQLMRKNVPVYITKYGLIDRRDALRQLLLKHYHLELVGRKTVEDWHLGFMKQVIVTNDLLRIKPR